MPPLTVHELIVTVIERASAQQEAHADPDAEWLPFNQILEQYNVVCAEKNVDSPLQQRVYQVLLMMSSETERELTWWQRVGQLDRYLGNSSSSGSSGRGRSISFLKDEPSLGTPRSISASRKGRQPRSSSNGGGGGTRRADRSYASLSPTRLGSRPFLLSTLMPNITQEPPIYSAGSGRRPAGDVTRSITESLMSHMAPSALQEGIGLCAVLNDTAAPSFARSGSGGEPSYAVPPSALRHASIFHQHQPTSTLYDFGGTSNNSNSSSARPGHASSTPYHRQHVGTAFASPYGRAPSAAADTYSSTIRRDAAPSLSFQQSPQYLSMSMTAGSELFLAAGAAGDDGAASSPLRRDQLAASFAPASPPSSSVQRIWHAPEAEAKTKTPGRGVGPSGGADAAKHWSLRDALLPSPSLRAAEAGSRSTPTDVPTDASAHPTTPAPEPRPAESMSPPKSQAEAPPAAAPPAVVADSPKPPARASQGPAAGKNSTNGATAGISPPRRQSTVHSNSNSRSTADRRRPSVSPDRRTYRTTADSRTPANPGRRTSSGGRASGHAVPSASPIAALEEEDEEDATSNPTLTQSMTGFVNGETALTAVAITVAILMYWFHFHATDHLNISL